MENTIDREMQSNLGLKKRGTKFALGLMQNYGLIALIGALILGLYMNTSSIGKEILIKLSQEDAAMIFWQVSILLMAYGIIKGIISCAYEGAVTSSGFRGNAALSTVSFLGVILPIFDGKCAVQIVLTLTAA